MPSAERPFRSPPRDGLPLCYGVFEEPIWILMFDRTERIRITHSLSGGGVDAAHDEPGKSTRPEN